MVLDNLPKRERKKKQYSTKLSVKTINQIHEISKERGISQAVLIEHLTEMAYQEFIKELEKEKEQENK